jgi:hypothetical protein
MDDFKAHIRMHPLLKYTLGLIAALVAGSLYGVCIYTAGIAPETGSAIAVVIAGFALFKMNQGSGRFLTSTPGKFRIPPFATILFIFGWGCYFAILEWLPNAR